MRNNPQAVKAAKRRLLRFQTNVTYTWSSNWSAGVSVRRTGVRKVNNG